MDCNRVREELEAYGLGALDANERTVVELHLAGCPDCRRLAAVYVELAHALPQGLAAASPLRVPPTLKEAVLRSIEETPAAAATTAAHTALNSRRRSPGNSRAEPDGRRVWRWWPSRVSLRTAVTFGTLIVLLVSLSWSVHLSLALNRERSLSDKLADLSSQQQSLIFDVIGSTKTIQVLLRPPPPGSTSYGKLYTRPDLPNVVAMAGRLPNPPAGQTYHLWLTSQGRKVLAGTLTVRNGFGVVIYQADHSGPVYDAAEVTLQPKGGTAPAGQVVLRWQASP